MTDDWRLNGEQLALERAREAERQRDRLLEAIKDHGQEWDESWWDRRPDPRRYPSLAVIWDGDQKLYETAKEVESEVGKR